jgi:hypothetical protein
MAFLFGRGSKASKSTTPYMGAELGSAQSPMHSGDVKGYGLGEAMGSGRNSRLPGEMTSARQYQDVPISQRGSVSRGMSPGQTRSLLARRGQLRGLEGRGTRPMSGTRSTGRMPKTNLGGRPVSSGYGSLVNNRQAEAMADFSRGNAAAIPKARVTGTASRSQSVSRGGLPGGAPTDINLGNRGQSNVNPFNTLSGPRSGGPSAMVTGTASRSQSVSRGGLPGGAPTDINLGNRGQSNVNPFNTLSRPSAMVTGTTSRAGSASRGGIPGGAPSNINLGNMGQVNRNPFNTFGGRTSGTPPVSPTGSGGTMPPGTSAPPPKKPKSSGGILRGLQNMSSRNKLMMGGGALVLGAAAYSGRRGDGTSSGRSGMTRY